MPASAEEIFAAIDRERSEHERLKSRYFDSCALVAAMAEMADEENFDALGLEMLRKTLTDFRAARAAYLPSYSTKETK